MTSHDIDETIAVGLVWGLLDGGQFEAAAGLAQATRLVWPDSSDLLALAALSQALAQPAADAEDPADTVLDDPALRDHLAADPRWSDLLATLHQRSSMRERLRQDHLAGTPAAPARALLSSSTRPGR